MSRKLQLLFALILVFAHSECHSNSVSLSLNVRPTLYNLTLVVNVPRSIYFVQESIHLNINESTTHISFHVSPAYVLRPYVIKLYNGLQKIDHREYLYDGKTNILTLLFEHPLEGGNTYRLSIFFKGQIFDENDGFLLSPNRYFHSIRHQNIQVHFSGNCFF